MDNVHGRDTQDAAYRVGETYKTHWTPDLTAAVQAFNDAWKGKKKVLIAEPSIGLVDYQAHEACWDLAFSLARYETESDYKFFKIGMGRLMVAYVREKFCEFAVDYGFDYILFIDDDHYWPSNLFQSLEKYIKEYDIVAPLCLQRLSPYYPVIYKSEMRQKDGQMMFDNHKYIDIKKFKKGDIITDADSIGFGAAIVKVDLLKKVPRPWFFSMSPVGEDILFCMKAKDVGAKILVDTSVEAPHLKDREPIFWADFEREYEKITGGNAKPEPTTEK